MENEKEAESLKTKEQICDTLIGKKFEIMWSEQVEYTTSVFAEDEEDARNQWDEGNHPKPVINESQIIDDSFEIYAIPEEEWKRIK